MRRRSRGRVIASGAVAVALVVAAWTATGPQIGGGAAPPTLAALDHDLDGIDVAFTEDPDCHGIDVAVAVEEVTCGTVAVPLHYDEPAGERIELAVAVFAGSGDTPLLLLGGGPGEVLVEPALTMPQVRQAYDVGRELVVVDQRGVGASTPALDCPGLGDVEPQDTPGEDLEAFLDALAACRADLAADGIDLDAFHHVANAHDVEVLRRALGYDEIDVRGGSYGSQLALLAATTHPDGIRSLVLSSPVDPTHNWVDGATAGFDDALVAVADACAADDACAGAFDDVRATIAATVDRLAAEPEEVTVQPMGGEEVTTTYTPTEFLGAVFLLFYVPDGPAVLPALVAAAEDGRMQPLAEIVALVEEQLDGAVSNGMQLSMVCSGEGAHATADAARDGVTFTPLLEHWLPAAVIGGEGIEAACEVWDVPVAYDSGEVEVAVDVPVLLVTGAFDHVTPAELGERLDARLPDTQLVAVPDAGHGPLETLGECGRALVAGFLDDPSAPLEDDCARRRPVRFLTQLPFG